MVDERSRGEPKDIDFWEDSVRIGIATFEYPVDTVGGGLYSTIVAQKLAEMGEEVHVFSAGTSEDGLESSRSGLYLHRMPVLSEPFFNLSYWTLVRRKIRTVADRLGPLDMLHSMGISGFGLPKRSRSWKFNVCTMHHLSKCTIEELHPGIYRRLRGIGSEMGLMHMFEEKCINWADRIIAVSEYTKNAIVRLYKKSPETIDVIPNAVPPEVLELSLRSDNELGARLTPEDTHNVLYVGRVYYRKRIRFLLEAFRKVLDQKDAKLWIIGPGDATKYLHLAKDLGIDQHVEFTGIVDRLTLEHFWRECDVFAFPSACEGFGLAILEAMIHGLPVVACQNTAIPEVVGDTGMLVDSNSVDSFADAIVSLLDQEGMRESLGQAGRKRATENYLSWTPMVQRIRDCYERLLNS